MMCFFTMPFAYARNLHFCKTVYVFLIFLSCVSLSQSLVKTHQRCRADWRLHTSSHANAEILWPMAVLVLLVMLNDVKVGCRMVLLATKVSYI